MYLLGAPLGLGSPHQKKVADLGRSRLKSREGSVESQIGLLESSGRGFLCHFLSRLLSGPLGKSMYLVTVVVI